MVPLPFQKILKGGVLSGPFPGSEGPWVREFPDPPPSTHHQAIKHAFLPYPICDSETYAIKKLCVCGGGVRLLAFAYLAVKYLHLKQMVIQLKCGCG